MSPADVIALRVPQEPPTKLAERLKPKVDAGEAEFVIQLEAWGIQFAYEPLFFPFEFGEGIGATTPRGFKPDIRLEATACYPQCYLEITLSGWDREKRQLVSEKALDHRRAVKNKRIRKLFRYYNLRTLLVDGPLYDAIVNQPDGRQRLYDEVGALFCSRWVDQLAA